MKAWTKKHLFGIKDLSRDEIDVVLSQAKVFKEISRREVKKVPALRGKTVLNLFFENSTRTRTSFELAAKRLSADVINFSASGSSLSKGESVVDTVKTLNAYHPDIMVVRVGSGVCLYDFDKYTQASIINAGAGQNEHPTQALLDMFTVQEIKGTLEGLNVLIVGDIGHSRVARSNIFAFQKVAAKIIVCAPPTFIPYEFDQWEGVEVSYDLDKVIGDADVIIMLRIQKERQDASFFPTVREYVSKFSLTPQRLAQTKKGCLILHPSPVNWDVEISSAVKEKVHPLILKQVENGLAVRMAVLYLTGTGQGILPGRSR